MELIVSTLNVAHGRGLAFSNWRGGSFKERIERLWSIADLVRHCDIVVLQEVDFRAPWSWWRLNDFELVRTAGEFDHAMTYCTSSFLPRSGIGILSRFPLTDRAVIRLPLYSSLYCFFGYHKHGLACTVTMGSDLTFRLIAVHFDHRGWNITAPSAERVIAYARQQTLPTVIAGDLNSTLTGFPCVVPPGQPPMPLEQPTALDLLRDSGLWQNPLFTQLPPGYPLYEWLTFPTCDPRCVIDWILFPPQWRCRHYAALGAQLSDHKPVVATLDVVSL